MNFDHKYNIGDTITWDTVTGSKMGTVKEITFKATEDKTEVFYLVHLINNKYVTITE